MAEHPEYIQRCRAFIMSTLNEQLAVVRPELEARISERYFVGHTDNIDPHHVTTALRTLTADGLIARATASTRGGHSVTTIQPSERRNRSTRIDAAARRKRALYARYLGWAQGTVRHPQGLIGPAGETAVRDAIIASGVMRPIRPNAGEVSTVLGVELSGPVDSAGYLITHVGDLPQAPITTLFEVKNIRNWIYPQAPELFQVLAKGTAVQRAHPNQPVLPILVCRRAHQTLFWMAKQLGFMVIEMARQFAGTAMTPDDVLEVRNGLDFDDLFHGTGPSLRVRERLEGPIVSTALDVSHTWKKTTMDLGDLIVAVHEAKPRTATREALLEDLRDASTQRGDRGGW